MNKYLIISILLLVITNHAYADDDFEVIDEGDANDGTDGASSGRSYTKRRKSDFERTYETY